ncbi:Serine/threonine protein phosphatase 7 long form isogeny [Senna tora]|uniref:Serine/threonine protein phosphatase 7 long form isogeny n=1 Tax=Senna tora TaxID=362788 RepID=A0A834WYB4_9FABA|nr:Serine/threonine protein phosphatase 7 long form isogeny [Senna tora]
MPDSSGNMVQLIYLLLLWNVEDTGKYSWDFAVLAFFFHEMCQATRWDCVNIGGCGQLLLAWA